MAKHLAWHSDALGSYIMPLYLKVWSVEEDLSGITQLRMNFWLL